VNEAEKEEGEDIDQDEWGEDIDEDEDEDRDEDEKVFLDTESVIFYRKGKKIMFGDKDEDNDEYSDYLHDEDDNSIGGIEQYEVEVTQDKNNSGAVRGAGEKEAPVMDGKNCEATEAPEVGEPMDKNKKKGGRSRKNERVMGDPDCDITYVMESNYSNIKSLYIPVNS